ncbi:MULTISPECIES: hypothetical protein [unclassified Acidovorax]|uniref:hypothetical protein n=1 Tax=unclassified Acidovorax TaxID=2684926 RepID=UPI00385738A2
MAHAAIECTGWFSLDGQAPDLWDALSGLYRCADGFVRLHANFAHHRDSGFGALQAVRHSAQLSRTPAGWSRPSVPPGTHPPHWP